MLPRNAVDPLFICSTSHSFEFPQRTLPSIHDARRPGGQLMLSDLCRKAGKKSARILGHVRAGKAVFVRAVCSAGFTAAGMRRS